MDARDIFSKFNDIRVLIVGDVMLDRYIWGVVERQSPEAPVPVVSVKKRDFRPGGAGNVTQNVLALGATPLLCALVGQDEAATRLMECFKKQNIRTEGLVESATRPTTEKTRVIAHEHHVVRIDEESESPLTPTEENMILDRIAALLPTAHVVIFQDYNKGVLSKNIIARTIAMANEKKIPTVVDPKRANFLSYENVTLFKPNLKELREGLQQKVDPRQEGAVQQAVTDLRKKLNARGVMATLSEHGIYIDFDGKQSTVPAHAREILDVSGAGDTVIAVAALCVALQLDARQIATLSNLAGGLVCQHVGVVPVDREEFLKEAIQLG